MLIKFEWVDNNDKKCILDEHVDEMSMKDSTDTFIYLMRIQRLFGFDKKTWILVLRLFYQIRFTKHNTSTWLIEGTINQLNNWFLSPVTNLPVEPRKKYFFRLNEKGVELYSILEGLFIIDDNDEINSEKFFKSLYDHYTL